MRSVLSFAAVAVVAGMVVPRYAEHMHPQSPHNALTTSVPSAATQGSAGSDSVEVTRDARGHFRVEGRIDGRRLDFVVDTGATVIALTADDAANLGLHPALGDYTMLMRTANGVIRAAPATLGMVEIGDIMMHDVSAVVMPEGALAENLLGMSFLSRLHHFDYSDGKLVLEQ